MERKYNIVLVVENSRLNRKSSDFFLLLPIRRSQERTKDRNATSSKECHIPRCRCLSLVDSLLNRHPEKKTTQPLDDRRQEMSNGRQTHRLIRTENKTRSHRFSLMKREREREREDINAYLRRRQTNWFRSDLCHSSHSTSQKKRKRLLLACQRKRSSHFTPH